MSANGEPPAVANLEAMAAALAHRGPDGIAHYRSGEIGIVHTRLAIIDLVTGSQPLFDPAGVALVANGEIYNYLELHAELPQTVFATRSDCELPLHLYRSRGLDFPRALRGMYAIALYDPAIRRLVLARDPFGIKPLYYAETARGFAFASEAQSLIRGGVVPAELVRQSRNELLQLQFTTGRRTIFAGINRVLPGETLVVAEGHIVERRRIEALPADGTEPMSERTALEDFDRVFEQSVMLHQRADVPYGMFLSGGIDSSAVLAMMARLNVRPVTAFTIGFSQTDAFDERRAARDVAAEFGAEHVEVEFREADFWNLLPEIAAVMDDAAADYATLPTYKLAATARQAGLKVILSGEGGDELFAGYGRYRGIARPWWAGRKRPHALGHLDRLGLLRGELAGWRDGLDAAELDARRDARTPVQVAQATDCADWLPNDLLTKLDRCLMAHGVEGRTPFLDPVVASFAFRLPDELKLHRGFGKYLLRRWLAGQSRAAQPLAKKRGFTVPVGEWIARRGAQLGPLVARQSCVREICLPNVVERLFREAARRREGFAAWTLLFYALWHRHHIECRPAATDVFATLGSAK